MVAASRGGSGRDAAVPDNGRVADRARGKQMQVDLKHMQVDLVRVPAP